jgi:hypothetical protein
MSDDRVKVAAGAPMGNLAERYKQLRTAMSDMKKAYDEQLEPYLNALSIIERAMLMKLHAEGATSAKTLSGTVYIRNNTTASIVDFDELWKYMQENDRPELLQRRLTLSAVTEINEANPEAPVPGVHTDTYQTIALRAK